MYQHMSPNKSVELRRDDFPIYFNIEIETWQNKVFNNKSQRVISKIDPCKTPFATTLLCALRVKKSPTQHPFDVHTNV